MRFTIFKHTMEELLRHRQLKIWNIICKEYSVSATKQQKISDWILKGSVAEEISQRYNTNFLKLKS
jgi:hypothetical protein